MLLTETTIRMRNSFLMAGSLLLSQLVCSQQLAFPGADGFGRYTTGGRGGKVYVVKNLNDSGPGSFREAVEAKHPRTVVFEVSGTIHLESPLRLSKNLTIAGQTAPGDGICLADQPVSIAGDNIIVRYLRFRLGDRYQNKGKVDGSGHDDAFGGNRKKHIIIDHCSMSWSNDEAFTVYDGDSTTLQWNIISEPLNYSYHFEEGDSDYERHGYGGIWGGRHLSAHHNLFIHCISRNPRFAGIRSSNAERVDYVNNVIYNWGHNNVYGGEGGSYNLINNFYKAGPVTGEKVKSRIVNPSAQKKPYIAPGYFYVSGNHVEGFPDVSKNNRKGIHFDAGVTDSLKNASVQKAMIGQLSVDLQTAQQAYNCILSCVGASFPARDSVDLRLIQELKEGTGRIIDVQGDFPHGTPYEETKGAWPVLNSLPPAPDQDQDGMPDEWERKSGLNPANAADASAKNLDKHYTNLEVYINGLLTSDKK